MFRIPFRQSKFVSGTWLNLVYVRTLGTESGQVENSKSKMMLCLSKKISPLCGKKFHPRSLLTSDCSTDFGIGWKPQFESKMRSLSTRVARKCIRIWCFSEWFSTQYCLKEIWYLENNIFFTQNKFLLPKQVVTKSSKTMKKTCFFLLVVIL